MRSSLSNILRDTILYNLKWQASPIDSGVVLKLPVLPSYFSFNKLAAVYLYDHKWLCSNDGTFCIYLVPNLSWIPIERDGSAKRKVFYRIDGDTMLLYVKSTEYVNTVFYKTRKDKVKLSWKMS